jgi:hypothetical protein
MSKNQLVSAVIKTGAGVRKANNMGTPPTVEELKERCDGSESLTVITNIEDGTNHSERVSSYLFISWQTP